MKLVINKGDKDGYEIQRITFYNGVKLNGFIESPKMTKKPKEKEFILEPFNIKIRLNYQEEKQPEFEVVSFLTN